MATDVSSLEDSERALISRRIFIEREIYEQELDREKWGLIPVVQVDSYKGLYFGTFDGDAPPLLEYLGEMTWYLDAFFQRREGGIEVLGGAHRWVILCNWKFPAENFAGDGYHVAWTHMSAIRTGFSQAPVARPIGGGNVVSPGNWHCAILVGGDGSPEPPVPEIMAYEDQIRPEVRKRLGPRLDVGNPIVATVFPNFSMLRASCRSFRVWQPRGPDSIEVVSWLYVDRAALTDIKEAVRLASVRSFTPSGTFEQDDMDNWQQCTATCRGGGLPADAAEHPDGLGPRRVQRGAYWDGPGRTGSARPTTGASTGAGPR